MDGSWIIYTPIIIGIAIVVFYALILYLQDKEYKKSAYYNITHLSYASVKRDPGRRGEYLSYLSLKRFEQNGAKFLFNVYIPKDNGETTEIDVLMICSNGIYVIECKNYSGWIFGSENQINWYQTLPTGRKKSHKEKFFNPIMQNRNHIKHLKNMIGDQFSVFSIVAFSDKCTIKNLQMNNRDTIVTKIGNLGNAAFSVGGTASGRGLNEAEMTQLYDQLYQYTQVSAAVKSQHIQNINNKVNHTSSSNVADSSQIENTTSDETQDDIATNVSSQTFEEKQVENNATDEQNSENDISAGACQAQTEEIADLTNSGAAENETNSVKQDSDESEQPRCPYCGGNLVLRKATRGVNAGKMFYGCSNYPKCRYTKNIS